MSDYSILDLKKSIEKLNLKKGETLYVSANIINLGILKNKNTNNIPELFYNELKKKLGKYGTIAFPTHTFNLVKEKEVFDPLRTLSISGSFSNYLIKKKKIYRQFHPYGSISATGYNAEFICKCKNKDVYGINSPFERLIKLNTRFLSIGIPINLNCTQVHHAELMMKVPYRYQKKFTHTVKIKNKIKKKQFFMFVLKEKHLKIRRNKNKLIVKNFLKNNKVKKTKLGNGYIHLYNLKDFYEENIKLLKKNIFCWVGKKI